MHIFGEQPYFTTLAAWHFASALLLMRGVSQQRFTVGMMHETRAFILYF
jgi:hypothetical protein